MIYVIVFLKMSVSLIKLRRTTFTADTNYTYKKEIKQKNKIIIVIIIIITIIMSPRPGNTGLMSSGG